jgi:hypothetical protein
MLTRYWFTFRKSGEPNVLHLGCGITAYDIADAQTFLREKVYALFGELPIDQVTENIDVRILEKNHVFPNIGNPAVRGVWFPSL